MSVKRGLGVKGVGGGGERKKEGAKKGEGVGLHSPLPPSSLKRGFTVVTKVSSVGVN